MAHHAGPVGAVTSFLGLVRAENVGRVVTYLDYEAYEPLAVKAFGRIADEIAELWPGATIGVHHRVGRVDIARGQHRHRRGVGAPGRRVCRVPVRHRAGEADRADLEARALRRRRRVDRRRHGRARRRGRAAGSEEARVRVTVRLFARLKDIAGAPELERDVPADATLADVWAQLARRLPGHGAVPRIGVGRPQRRVRAHGRRRCRRRRDCVSAAGIRRLAAKHLECGAEAPTSPG